LILPRSPPSCRPKASHTDRQSTLLVRTDEPIHDPAWTVEEVSEATFLAADLATAADLLLDRG
jgi:ABC-2 type transport system ATP-binding protein